MTSHNHGHSDMQYGCQGISTVVKCVISADQSIFALVPQFCQNKIVILSIGRSRTVLGISDDNRQHPPAPHPPDALTHVRLRAKTVP